jgi:hypothetical protein
MPVEGIALRTLTLELVLYPDRERERERMKTRGNEGRRAADQLVLQVHQLVFSRNFRCRQLSSLFEIFLIVSLQSEDTLVCVLSLRLKKTMCSGELIELTRELVRRGEELRLLLVELSDIFFKSFNSLSGALCLLFEDPVLE